MIRQARERHPSLDFREAEAHTLELDETFDAILLSDLVNDLWDVQTALERLRPLCSQSTRGNLNLHSRRHGMLLIRMVAFAAFRLKFI